MTDIEWRYASDPRWMCCLPLLHFLDGTAVPFEELAPSTTYQHDAWWGFGNCEKRKKSFKTNSKEAK
jgi:hypothetical protein